MSSSHGSDSAHTAQHEGNGNDGGNRTQQDNTEVLVDGRPIGPALTAEVMSDVRRLLSELGVNPYPTVVDDTVRVNFLTADDEDGQVTPDPLESQLTPLEAVSVDSPSAEVFEETPSGGDMSPYSQHEPRSFVFQTPAPPPTIPYEWIRGHYSSLVDALTHAGTLIYRCIEDGRGVGLFCPSPSSDVTDYRNCVCIETPEDDVTTPDTGPANVVFPTFDGQENYAGFEGRQALHTDPRGADGMYELLAMTVLAPRQLPDISISPVASGVTPLDPMLAQAIARHRYHDSKPPKYKIATAITHRYGQMYVNPGNDGKVLKEFVRKQNWLRKDCRPFVVDLVSHYRLTQCGAAYHYLVTSPEVPVLVNSTNTVLEYALLLVAYAYPFPFLDEFEYNQLTVGSRTGVFIDALRFKIPSAILFLETYIHPATVISLNRKQPVGASSALKTMPTKRTQLDRCCYVETLGSILKGIAVARGLGSIPGSAAEGFIDDVTEAAWWFDVIFSLTTCVIFLLWICTAGNNVIRGHTSMAVVQLYPVVASLVKIDCGIWGQVCGYFAWVISLIIVGVTHKAFKRSRKTKQPVLSEMGKIIDTETAPYVDLLTGDSETERQDKIEVAVNEAKKAVPCHSAFSNADFGSDSKGVRRIRNKDLTLHDTSCLCSDCSKKHEHLGVAPLRERHQPGLLNMFTDYGNATTILASLGSLLYENATSQIAQELIVQVNFVLQIIYASDGTGGKVSRGSAIAVWMMQYGKKLLDMGQVWANNIETVTSNAGKLESLENALTDYRNFKNTSLFRELSQIFTKIMTFGTLVGVGGSEKITENMWPEWITKGIQTFRDCESLGESLVSVSLQVVTAVTAVMNGSRLTDAVCLHATNDREFTEISTACLDLSSVKDLQIVIQKIKSYISKMKVQMNSKNSSARMTAMTRIQACEEWLGRINRRININTAKDQPFVLSLVGAGGCGKTTAMNAIMTILHAWYNKLHPDQQIDERVGTFSFVSKYDDNLNSDTTGIQVNDMCFIDAEKMDQSPAATIQRLVDSQVAPYNKAEAHEKGKEFNMAKFVILSSNHPTLGLTKMVTDPSASMRRAGIIIECVIKKEYCDSRGMPDPLLFPDAEGGLPKQIMYQVKKYNKVTNEMVNDGPPLTSAECLGLIRLEFNKHWRRCKKARDSLAKPSLCPVCDMPKGNGCTCRTDSDEESETLSKPPVTAQSNAGFVKKLRYLHYYHVVYSKLLDTPLLDIFCPWALPVSVRVHRRWMVAKRLEESYYALFPSQRPKTRYYVSVPMRACCAFGRLCDLCGNLTHGLWSVTSRYSGIKQQADYYWDEMINNPRFSAQISVPLVLSATLGTLAVVYAHRKWLGSKVQHVISNMYQGQNPVPLEDRRQMLKETKPWRTTVVKKVLDTPQISSTPMASVNKMFASQLVDMRAVDYDRRTHGIVVVTRTIVYPSHLWYGVKEDYLNIEYRASNFKGTVTLHRLTTVTSEHSDIAMSRWEAMGDRKNLFPYFSNSPPAIGKQISQFEYQDTHDGSSHLVALPATVESYGNSSMSKWPPDSPGSKLLQTFYYSHHVAVGDCFMPIMSGDDRSCAVVGVHIGFHKVDGKCISHGMHVKRAELEQMENQLLQSPLLLSTTTAGPPLSSPRFPVDISEKLHKNNLLNFMPSDPDLPGSDNPIRILGDIGKKSTMVVKTQEHPFKEAHMKMFNLPAIVPVSRQAFKSSMREFVGLSLNEQPTPDLAILDKVAKELIARFSTMIDEHKSLKRKEPEMFPGFVERPYSIDEVVNGVDGHCFRHGINKAASAGEPFRQKKSKLLYERPNGKFGCHEDVYEMVAQARSRLESGVSAGVIYGASGKDEGRPEDKAGNMRIFQCTSLILHLIFSCEFGPLQDVMTCYPDKSYSAVGISPFGRGWEAIAQVCAPGRKVLEYDYSKWDLTIPVQFREMIGNVFVKLTAQLYDRNGNDFYMCYLERLYQEVVTPLVDVNGALVHLPALWPSGIPPTAAGGAMIGLALSMYSYYSHNQGKNVPEYLDIFRRMGLGDDGIESIPEEHAELFNQKILEIELRKLGMKVTGSDKSDLKSEFTNNKDATFLCRENVYVPFLQGVRGRLQMTSVLKSLTVLQRSTAVDLPDQVASQYDNLMIEMVNYPQSAYEAVQARILHVCKEVGIVPNEVTKRTYLAAVLSMCEANGVEPHWCDMCDSCKKKATGYQMLGEDETWREFIKEIPRLDTEEVVTSNMEVGGEDQAESVECDGIATHDAPADVTPVAPEAPITYTQSVDTASLEKEVVLATYNVTTDLPIEHSYDLYKMFEHAFFKTRLSYVNGFTCSIKVRAEVSSSSAHAGEFIMSVMPMHLRVSPFQNESLYSTPLRNVLESSRPHVRIGIGLTSTVEALEIPMLTPDLLFTYDNLRVLCPRLTLRTTVPLMHAMNLSQPATITLFGKLENVYTVGLTSLNRTVQSNAEFSEPPSSRMANMSSTLHSASSLLSSAPPLAIAAEVASAALSVGSGVARALGHSRPIENEVGISRRTTTQNMCVTDTNVQAKKLSLFSTQSVSIKHGSAANTGDPLSHEFLLPKSVIVGTYEWKSDDPTQTVLFRFGVSPMISVSDGSDKRALTPCGCVASQYLWWSGDMHYRIKVIGPSSFGGELAVYVAPNRNETPSPATNESFTMNLARTRECNVKVGWMSNVRSLQTMSQKFPTLTGGHVPGFTNGEIMCVVINKLSTMADLTQKVTILLEASADPNMLFYSHVNGLEMYELDHHRRRLSTQLPTSIPETQQPTTVDDTRNASTDDFFPASWRGPGPMTGIDVVDIDLDEAENWESDEKVTPWWANFGKVFRRRRGIKVELPILKVASIASAGVAAVIDATTPAPTQQPTSVVTQQPTSVRTTQAPTTLPVPCQGHTHPYPPESISGSKVELTLWSNLVSSYPTVRTTATAGKFRFVVYSDGISDSVVELTLSAPLTIRGVASSVHVLPVSLDAGLHEVLLDWTGDANTYVKAVNVTCPVDHSWVVWKPGDFSAFPAYVEEVENIGGYNQTVFKIPIIGTFTHLEWPMDRAACWAPTKGVWIGKGSLRMGHTDKNHGSLMKGRIEDFEPGVQWRVPYEPGYWLHGISLLTKVTTSNAGQDVPSHTWSPGGVQPLSGVIRSLAGERTHSLLTLCRFPLHMESYKITEEKDTVVTPLYELCGGPLNIQDLILVSFAGVRGGETIQYHVTNPQKGACIYVARTSGATPNVIHTIGSGFEFQDTGVNPVLEITHPFYSSEAFYTPRNFEGMTLRSSSLSLRCVFKRTSPLLQDRTVDISEYRLFSEDFSVVEFLGFPVLHEIDKQESVIFV